MALANFGENDRFWSHMFETGNRVRFEGQVDEKSRQWWIEKFYEPFGLTPEGMADLITKSAPGEKLALFHYIDATREAFSLRVDGDFPGTQEFWYAHRELDLKGSAFNAEGMTVSDAMQGGGYGRALMGDLIDAGRLIGIERIRLRAERVGRYVWVKMGFLPSDDSWRQMRKDALEFVVKHQSILEPRLNVRELMARIYAGGPEMVRLLASIEIEVPSEHIASRFEPELMPFGKAFFLEAAPDWSGSLDLRDEEAMKIVESYRKSK
jgi:GNAT superfamily N-acetyltransferase